MSASIRIYVGPMEAVPRKSGREHFATALHKVDGVTHATILERDTAVEMDADDRDAWMIFTCTSEDGDPGQSWLSARPGVLCWDGAAWTGIPVQA